MKSDYFLQKTNLLRIGIILSFLYCYANVFINLIVKWKEEDIYSYGFLIPIISLYFIWLKRKEIQKIQKRPDIITGFFIIFIGLINLVLGYIGSIVLLQELSIIFTITGLVFFIFGKRVFHVIWFPILYLIFMIPIWDSVLNPLHYPFQYLSASVGVRILQWIGIPVYQNEIFIELPNITLVVASVCSGVNYLIAIVAIGIPLSYFYLYSFKRRILLLIISVLIAILSNGFRVSAIGYFAYVSNNVVGEKIHGPFDIFRSMIISFIGFIALFIGVMILKEKNINNVSSPQKIESKENINYSFREKNKKYMFYNYFISLSSIIILLGVGTFVNFYKHKSVPLRKNIKEFPYVIGKWEGVDINNFAFTEDFKKFGVDYEVVREYRDQSNNVVKLYIGYWDFQRQGKELVNYNIDGMLNKSSRYKLPQNTIFIYDEKEIVTDNADGNDFFIYWIDINGRNVGKKHISKAYNILDFIIDGRTNSAIVLLKVNKIHNDSIKLTIDQYSKFISELYAVLKLYLPQR